MNFCSIPFGPNLDKNRSMADSSRKLLLASIHDVSPRFEREIDQLSGELEGLVGTRYSMLVVPNHWGSSPIVPGSPFATRIRSWADAGVEMILHGYYHRDDVAHRGMDRIKAKHLTASEGEFLGLDRCSAKRRIVDGSALLEDITGRPVRGFVAPAWLYGKQVLPAIAEAGIEFIEDHFRIWCPATQETLARGPAITWATRTRLRLATSLAAAAVLGRIAPQPVLRIALHPSDCSSQRTLTSIRATLDRAARLRLASSYSEIRRTRAH